MTNNAPNAVNLLVVEPNIVEAQKLRGSLSAVGSVFLETTEAAATRALSASAACVLIAGLTTSAPDACAILRRLRAQFPAAACILVADYGEYAAIDQATRRSDNFLLVCRPCEPEKLVQQATRAVQAARMQMQILSMRNQLKLGTG